MAEPLASLEDFESRHGEVPPDRVGTVEALLADASALILAEVEGSTAGWVVGDDDPPRAVVSVCVEVAYRAWRNPDALASSQLGTYSETRSGYSLGGTAGAMWLTDRERRTVRRAAKRSTFRAVTLVSPYSGDDIADETQIP